MAKPNISDEELSKIMEDVDTLSVDEVKNFLESYQQRIQHRRDYNKSRNLTDAQKQSRKEYNDRRRKREKAIILKAKEIGLI